MTHRDDPREQRDDPWFWRVCRSCGTCEWALPSDPETCNNCDSDDVVDTDGPGEGRRVRKARPGQGP